MKYVGIFIVGFILAIFSEKYIPGTNIDARCYQDGTNKVRTEVWIKTSGKVYYPYSGKIVNSYRVLLQRILYEFKEIECDEFVDGNKK